MIFNILIKRFFLLLFLAGLFYSCQTKEKLENKTKHKFCPSRNVPLMFTVDHLEKRFKTVIQNESNQEGLLVGVMDSINSLTKQIIDRSGGVADTSWFLLNGCQSAKYQYVFFEKYKKEQIGSFYKRISTKDKLGLHFVDVLNRYFFAPYKYFTNDYFKTVTINQLSADLLTMQLELLDYDYVEHNESK